MGTEILKSFGNLQSELEQAKNSLKGVDENIKRLIGRDPSELPIRPGQKRLPPNDEKGRSGLKTINRNRNHPYENNDPPSKRRNNISIFKRLSDRVVPDEEVHIGLNQKQMISKVIVTPKEVPSREEALEAQNKDEKFKARNKRMFGALLGTLQKFQQEETKLKPREEKRAQLERKIEEHEIKEKEEIKKEKQELFLNRKKKQIEIKIIELKMMRMKEYAAWEVCQRPRSNFIATKAEPRVLYLPRRMNDKTKELLDASKSEVEAMIDKKKQAIYEELKHIEERMKKNVESKLGPKETKMNEEKHETDGNGDHLGEILTELPTTNEGDEEVDKSGLNEPVAELPCHTEEGNDKDNQNKENNSQVDGETMDDVVQEVSQIATEDVSSTKEDSMVV